MKAIRVQQPGGPEALKLEEVPTPTPGAGAVLIKVSVAGVNFADQLMLMPPPPGMPPRGPHAVSFPNTPGFEVAGIIVTLGEGVRDWREGERVVAALESGGYAEYAVAPVDKLVKIPDGVNFTDATAGLLIQGLTAYGLLHDAARLQAGESVLVQAAAGGVGTLAVQLAKLAGAGRVIGTASSQDKRDLILSLGADVAIDYTQPDWAAQVRQATGGRGVDIILESVGGAVGAQALQALAPLGRLVMFGSASGRPMPAPDLMGLNFQGQSLMGYGGPWLRPGRATAAREVLSQYLQEGQLKVIAGPGFPLAQAANALGALISRQSTGKVVLTL